MTKFYSVRVVLHNDHVELTRYSEGYTLLHKGMTDAGFKSTITGEDQVTYELPAGEYVGQSSDDIGCAQLREFVGGIAAGSSQPYSVYVCEVVAFAWEGLKKA